MADAPIILVVDDEQSNLDTVEAMLVTERYEIRFAMDGAECFRQLKTIEPDLILLDVMMPEITGYEVCRELKKNQEWQHIPVIMVTALDSKADLAKAFEAGADDFLNKPVNAIELRARARSLLRIKTQFDDLKDELKLRDELSNMIVHDVRTPLSVAIGMASLIKANLKDNRLDHYLSRLDSNIYRANSMLNDLLLLAKMKNGKLLVNKNANDLIVLLENTVANFTDLAKSRGIEISFVNECPNVGEVGFDKTLFTRVMDNLISNAFKYAPRNSTITIAVDSPSDRDRSLLSRASVRIQVIDEGPGIPESDRERVFDMFETRGARRANTASFGLGLTFCRMVVDAHAGRIWADANTPCGTVINVLM